MKQMIEKIEMAMDYEWSQRPKLEKRITLAIPLNELDKLMICKLSRVIVGYSRTLNDDSVVRVKIWEHNETHWNLVMNILSEDDIRTINDFQ